MSVAVGNVSLTILSSTYFLDGIELPIKTVEDSSNCGAAHCVELPKSSYSVHTCRRLCLSLQSCRAGFVCPVISCARQLD